MFKYPVRRPLGLSLTMAAVLAAATSSAFAAPAPASAPPAAKPAAAATTVRIDNFTFGPATLVIKPGTTVTWVNNDDIPHAVVAVDHSFRSKVLDTGDRYDFTFAKAGEYAYFCSLHPHMVGKIVVKG
jgi:plastocyanin